ncbi:carbohydrate ABC transporter permease [Mycoplana dimorpha]|uniref:Carbohydrate ABC transporter membrane protein 1 (CUT1 family) n=1 Tax=Mycoplana dimorpha TaxID=28320 RepID=A0A2T5B3N7_MYCDI|nr:sugar ABC transporter permease [Mycoplana dimorpha]PTM93554.1 carbohydrate ABC transporter membrane protein 1 (CUT1 family) [Mycoplana dimorpha]
MTRSFVAKLAPWLFVGPAVLSVVVFLYGPILASAGLSVVDWNLLSPQVDFVGLNNYRSLLANTDFQLSAWNTFLYCVILVPAQIVLPLLFAVMIHAVRGSRMERVYRGSLFLPTILAYSVAGVAWSRLLNPINGLFNEVLVFFGFGPSRWHTDPDLALLCVCLVTFWKSFGLNMLLWIAALANVPDTLREAARLDGAGPWRRFFSIELPLISPTAFFISVTTVFSVLDDIVGVVDVLTGGGPAGRSSNLLYFLWQQGLQFFQFGPASAVAMVSIAIVLAITCAQFWFGEKRVHYQ